MRIHLLAIPAVDASDGERRQRLILERTIEKNYVRLRLEVMREALAIDKPVAGDNACIGAARKDIEQRCLH